MIITIHCQDAVGLVSSISGILAKEQLNIISMREHVDIIENSFYTRIEVGDFNNKNSLIQKLKIALPFDATVTINETIKKRIVLLVTKEYHCLADLLIRNYFDTLGAEICCVIGNHLTLQNICERFDVPFFYISTEAITKEIFEKIIIEKIQSYTPDYIVLAKFMRILSPNFVAHFPNKLINIHHSFLPAFAGANPYRQAFERGVKLIGATAHFVTNDLDEGPIIAQQIIPVNHSNTTTDMMKAGKEIETAVLAKAVRLIFEDRVFVYKNKTIVFE